MPKSFLIEKKKKKNLRARLQIQTERLEMNKKVYKGLIKII